MTRHRYNSLADYLDATGTTQEELAAKLAVSQATISRIVRGLQMPEAALALKIHELTGVSVDALARARTAVAS